MNFKKYLRKLKKKSKTKDTYWLTRFVLLRILGFVFLFAFLSLALQVLPLIGSNGITPAATYLEQVSQIENPYWKLPTLFWLNASDTWLHVGAWVGVVVSALLLLGFANVPIIFILWFLYMSYVHIGQTWYGYGWEIQILETSFIALFMVPLLDPRPFPKFAPPQQIIWLFRWLAFRIYVGAGLIKIRGDECWRKFTCLVYHYETQPIPGPLSRLFHFKPEWIHMLGVAFNHFVELIVPYFVIAGRLWRNWAGVLMLAFQLILIASGNLSFLNWLTIVPIIAYFDDSFLKKVLPKKLVAYATKAQKKAQPISTIRNHLVWLFVVIVVIMSVPVVKNLFFSSTQVMNTSFNQLHLVNTYGAFGTVGSERNELIIEGFDGTRWKEYDFIGKPGPLDEAMPQIAPYQPRLDWQIWFAAMSHPQREPWLLHMVWKLLHNDPGTLSLLESNPFPNKPPQQIRIQFYRYTFAPYGSDTIWERKYLGTWLPPMTKEHPELVRYLQAYGWI